jgi:hypothetical protein
MNEYDFGFRHLATLCVEIVTTFDATCCTIFSMIVTVILKIGAALFAETFIDQRITRSNPETKFVQNVFKIIL